MTKLVLIAGINMDGGLFSAPIPNRFISASKDPSVGISEADNSIPDWNMVVI